MQLPALRAYHRSVTTPFGLLGTGENALSFALGYTLRECPLLLQQLLGSIGIPNVRRTALSSARIDLQRHGAESGRKGITDIEIRLPGQFHVIIEAKIGLDIPSIGQCEKYAPGFDESTEPIKRLVALVQSPDETFDERHKRASRILRGIFRVYNWSELLPACVRLMRVCGPNTSEGMAVRWLYEFLDYEYEMKTFTTEVWIVPTSSKPLWLPDGLSFIDMHLKFKVYFETRHQLERPLYIALQSGGRVEALYRVLRVEHEMPPVTHIPCLSNVEDKWPTLPHTIWHLDDAVPLSKPIPSGGNNVYRRSVRCDMDVLLTSTSVLEVETRMRERREKAG